MPKSPNKMSKKKKFNSRFPPARIKKIMQTDEEVGKVAAAVPVIISRALELFIESLITKTSETTVARNAKTLSTSHIKHTIESNKQFDFLRDLVSKVPDHNCDNTEESNGGDTMVINGEPPPKKKRGRPRKIKDPVPGLKKAGESSKETPQTTDDEEDEEDDEQESDEEDEEEESINSKKAKASTLPSSHGSATKNVSNTPPCTSQLNTGPCQLYPPCTKDDATGLKVTPPYTEPNQRQPIHPGYLQQSQLPPPPPVHPLNHHLQQQQQQQQPPPPYMSGNNLNACLPPSYGQHFGHHLPPPPFYNTYVSSYHGMPRVPHLPPQSTLHPSTVTAALPLHNPYNSSTMCNVPQLGQLQQPQMHPMNLSVSSSSSSSQRPVGLGAQDNYNS